MKRAYPAVIFLGPSLPAAEAGALLPPAVAEVRPPACRGDVYRAAREGVRTIALIDGCFGSVPAVLHKEILWALDQGCRVVGAASLGALRAAELDAFGMEGLGEVYAAFRSGRLIDDDEVAVIHAPAELGHAPLSEALVDLRAGLAEARRHGILTAREQFVLLTVAKRLHFGERRLENLLAGGRADGLAPDSLARLATWWPAGARSAKRDDARLLLGLLARGRLPDPPPPPARLPRLVETPWWRAFLAAEEGRATKPAG